MRLMRPVSFEARSNAGCCPFVILLAFSGMRAALAASSGFNDRVAECHAAAAQLLERLQRPQEPALLGDVSQDEYAAHRHALGAPPLLPNPTVPGALCRARNQHFAGRVAEHADPRREVADQ